MSQRPSAMPWPPLLLASAIGLGIGLNHMAPVMLFGGPLSRIAGLLLAAAALALDAVAVLYLIWRKTSVLPHHGAKVFATTGPFAFSRNPIYLGNVLLTAGLSFALANAWLLASAAIEAFLLKRLAITSEERHLEARFGDAWHAYRARAPRWLGVGLRSSE